eukprot:4797809-Karenia_brevis.AAC.1
MDYFGFNDKTKPIGTNGDREDKVEEWEEEFLDKPGAKECRGLAARLNFMSLDWPERRLPLNSAAGIWQTL